MVIKTTSLPFPKRGGGFSPHAPSSRELTSHPKFSFARCSAGPTAPDMLVVSSPVAAEVEDVIDLGAPRRLHTALSNRIGVSQVPRKRRPYTPNPRLYPGLTGRGKRKERTAVDGAQRHRKRVFKRPVPNSRLYRPAPRPPPTPPAAPPAPLRPRAAWPPPSAPRSLDTASHAALRLAERRLALPAVPTYQSYARGGGGGSASAGPRLVVQVPAAGDAPRPARALTAGAAHHPAASLALTGAADCVSVPSEFLAEFLSAIMQRQFAEALKYCRLILQYEPHNATARGFYPLLKHKLEKEKKSPEGVSSEEASQVRDPSIKAQPSEALDPSISSSGSETFESSDLSAASARSRSGSEASCAPRSSPRLGSSASTSGSLSYRSDDTSASRSVPSSVRSGVSAESLQNLRAQFACSVK